VRSKSPAVVLGWNSGATRVGVVREELRKLPGGGAELTRGLGRGWGAAERPVHGGAEGLVRWSKAGKGLGFRAAATSRG
jgi:hypothetical protein